MTPAKHSRPERSRQELLYDPDVPTPTHAERARTLVQTLVTGTLCTLAHDRSGHPYGSFVTFALDEGCPVLLISELAEHTRNLRADSRASLLVVEPGEGDPLARGRVTLVGQARILEPGEDRQRAREAFLASHPNSSYYVDFKDFHLWTLEPDAIRYIGGYGRMSWIEAAPWSSARPDPIAPYAKGILTHMNADHADTIVAYCKALTRATDTTAAVMTGVDRYGFDMSATTGAGPRPIRLAFSQEVGTSEQVREEMVALARRARRH